MYYTEILDAEPSAYCGGDECNVLWDSASGAWVNEGDDCDLRCRRGDQCRLTPVSLQGEEYSYMDCESGLFCLPGPRNNGLGVCTRNEEG